MPQPSLNDRLIAARISTLLSHYWTADEPPELRREQMADWLNDLAEFAAQHVAAACQEWRQSEAGTKRPTPANIRMLTIAEARKHAKPPPLPQITDMAREPMPAPDVVRQHWRKIPRSLLTEAELVLFVASAGDVTDETLRQIAMATLPSAQRTG